MAETSAPKPLAEWRKVRDITQFDLAVRAGVSLSTITGVEYRRVEVGILAARRIAAVLGVGVDDIIWPSEDEVEAARERRRSKKEAA